MTIIPESMKTISFHNSILSIVVDSSKTRQSTCCVNETPHICL